MERRQFGMLSLIAMAITGCGGVAFNLCATYHRGNLRQAKMLNVGTPSTIAKPGSNYSYVSDQVPLTTKPHSFANLDLSGLVESDDAATLDIERSMKQLDSFIDEVRNYCSSTPVGEQCIVPAGKLSITYAPDLVANLTFIEKTGATNSFVNSGAAIETARSLGEIRYAAAASAPYDWSLNVETSNNGEKESSIYRWNTTKTELSVNRRVDWKRDRSKGSVWCTAHMTILAIHTTCKTVGVTTIAKTPSTEHSAKLTR